MLVPEPHRSGPVVDELDRDQALLESDRPIALRTYAFEPSSITIGRFQDAEAFADFGVPIARRRTGGGAIWHHDECTYAVAGDAALLGRTVEDLFERVHGALVDALQALGVRCEMLGRDGPAPHPRAVGVDWCFAKACRFDLVAPDGRKLAGGAQRRSKRPSERVLIHGSLPYRRPPSQDFCATVADQVDPDTVRTLLPDLFAERLQASLAE